MVRTQQHAGAMLKTHDWMNHTTSPTPVSRPFPIGVAVRAAGSRDRTRRVRLSGIPVAAVAGG